MEILVILGRILFSAIFIMSSFNHFSQASIQYAQSKRVPMAKFLVPLSGLLILFGGLSVLFGFEARCGAWFLILFLVPTTLMMHNFWAISDPKEKMNEQINFMKNLSMLGGALLIAYFGSGPFSIK